MKNTANALELKLILDNLRPMNSEQEAKIMQKFRLDWNYHSNHLEGNSLTYGETKALLLFGITAQGKPLKDTLEITGHNEAINWVLEMIEGKRPLTENFIRELHSLLLQDSYKNSKTTDGKNVPRKITPGKYKTTPNHVETPTGEMFYFASPEETPAKMYDLLSWYNQKVAENFNPILLAAEFHYKFIIIHPFDDGNGRTARILMNFILMKFGYPPVIIKTEDKSNYFAVLQLADAGNIEVFLEYIAENLIRSLEIMIAGANGENIEEDDDLDKEIALLEQRLNFISEKTDQIKTLKKINEIFDYTIKNIESKLFTRSEKFSKFYLNTEITIEIDSKSIPSNYDYAGIKNSIFENTNRIKLITNFIHFKNIGFDNFFYQSNVVFLFGVLSYKVILNDNCVLEKPYGIQLTESEINMIVKSELKKHKDFIEQKIAEKENKV